MPTALKKPVTEKPFYEIQKEKALAQKPMPILQKKPVIEIQKAPAKAPVGAEKLKSQLALLEEAFRKGAISEKAYTADKAKLEEKLRQLENK